MSLRHPVSRVNITYEWVTSRMLETYECTRDMQKRHMNAKETCKRDIWMHKRHAKETYERLAGRHMNERYECSYISNESPCKSFICLVCMSLARWYVSFARLLCVHMSLLHVSCDFICLERVSLQVVHMSLLHVSCAFIRLFCMCLVRSYVSSESPCKSFICLI